MLWLLDLRSLILILEIIQLELYEQHYKSISSELITFMKNINNIIEITSYERFKYFNLNNLSKFNIDEFFNSLDNDSIM